MGENMEILIKLLTTDRRRNYFVSIPNYHTTKYFCENSLATEMKKPETHMNKPVYLELSVLEFSKILMYEFWQDDEKEKLCYIQKDAYGFIV